MPAEPTIHTAAALLAGAGTLTAAAPQSTASERLRLSKSFAGKSSSDAAPSPWSQTWWKRAERAGQ